MLDPFFHVALWEIRGFDLGDDDALLAELEERTERSADDDLLLAILRHREGRPGVHEALDAARSDPQREALACYLEAQLFLDDGNADEAQRLLDRCDSAAAGGVDPAHVMHARGTLARLRGNPQEAVDLYTAALELEPADEERWRVLAGLFASLQEYDRAEEALQRALELDPESSQTRYELAACAAMSGDGHTAARELERAFRVDPDLRERARRDERFGTAEDSGVRDLLQRGAPDLAWLDAFPPWLQGLRQDPQAEATGLRWLGKEESRELSAHLERAYERGPLGTLHSNTTLAHSRRCLRSRKPVAFGPEALTRDGAREATVLFIDVHDVDRLYLAPSHAYPPFLWIDVGQSIEAIRDASQSLLGAKTPSRLSLTRRARGFMGYRLRFGVPNPYGRDPEPANAMELDRHFSLSPFLDTGAWGSAFVDDPWPESIPPQPELVSKLAQRQQRMTAQADGAVWSMTRRTRLSRSRIRLELHQRDLFVLDVRYRPSPFAEVVESLNAEFGCDYPNDMPLDAIGVLLGFQFDAAADVQEVLDATAGPAEIAGLLAVVTALRYDDLRVTQVFRRYMDHPEAVVRTALCNLFAAYNFESLLEEMAVLEPDPELAEEIEGLLDEGLAPVDIDPYQDYGLDDDDDDDASALAVRSDLRNTVDVPQIPEEPD